MRTEVKLSKRLERIASFVQPGSRVADIGTDHGYVPIWLELCADLAGAEGRVPVGIGDGCAERPTGAGGRTRGRGGAFREN